MGHRLSRRLGRNRYRSYQRAAQGRATRQDALVIARDGKDAEELKQLVAQDEAEREVHAAAFIKLLEAELADQLVDGSPGPADQEKRRRQRTYKYHTCAVVGSGADLRCGKAHGSDIDAHDAVFRSNAAQHVEEGDATSQRINSDATDASVSRAVRRFRIAVHRAGQRSTFRVNSLFRGRLPLASLARGEVMVVSQQWFAMP